MNKKTITLLVLATLGASVFIFLRNSKECVDSKNKVCSSTDMTQKTTAQTRVRVMDELHLEQSSLKRGNSEELNKNEINEKLEKALGLDLADQQMDAVLTQRLGKESDNERVQAILKIVSEFKMFSKLQASLEEELTEIEKENLISFYNSPLVQKMKKAAQENITQPDLAEKMQEFIEDFDRNEVDQERLALINAIQEKSGAEKVQKSQAMVFSQALTKSLLMAMSQDKSEQEIDTIVTGALKGVETEFDRSYFPAVYYSFNSLSKEELKEYLDLYSLHPQDLYADKFTSSLEKIAEEFGKKVGDVMSKSN